MLALARAFAAQPRLLLLDEPSLGLAPLVVDEVFAAIRRFMAERIAVVLVEQYVQRALEVADDVVVLRHGSVDWSGAGRRGRRRSPGRALPRPRLSEAPSRSAQEPPNG